MRTKKLADALDLIRKAGCKNLIFEIENNKLFLKAENEDGISMNIPLNSNEKKHTENAEFKYDSEILISSFDFENILKKILPAVCQSEYNSNEAIKGIFFEVDGNNLRCAGTDGFQIASLNFKLKNSFRKESFIIPYQYIKNFADKIKKINSSNFIEIKCTNKEFLKIFSISQRELKFKVSGKLIDAEFPKYEKFFPSNFNAVTKLKTLELKKILDMLSPIASRDYNHYLKIIFSQDKLFFLSKADGVGTGKIFINADCNFSETITIDYNKINFELNGINSKYIQIGIYEFEDKKLFSLREVGNTDFDYCMTSCSRRKSIENSSLRIAEAKKNISLAESIYEKLKANLEAHKCIYEDVPSITLSEARKKVYYAKDALENIIKNVQELEDEQKWLDSKEV